MYRMHKFHYDPAQLRRLHTVCFSLEGAAVEESAFPVAAGERDRLEQRIHLPAFVYAPVARGEVLGEAVYSLDGEELARVALVAEEAVPAQEPAEAGDLWSRLRSLLPGGAS